MANAKHGRSGRLEIGTDQVGSTAEITYDTTMEEVDTTAMGDEAKTYLAGPAAGGGTIRSRWDMASSPNAGQVALETAALAGTPVTITWYPTGKVNGQAKYSGSVVLTSQGVRASVDSLIEYTVGFRGFLTRSTYTA